ncbi:MAG TPA: DUF4846 domain-containing protein [Chitinophagaceae bacterium]|nr:DUF4846 domain-containing protein [Chitinophagaceae bacterium]
MQLYSQLLPALLITISSCTDPENKIETRSADNITAINTETIRGIPLPKGFNYVDDGDSAYSNWLLDLKLKKSKTVYLYNGKLKSNQDVQYGVLNIDIGKKDLIQCADAAMKLRADHLFEKHLYDQIKFISTSGNELSFKNWLKGIRWKVQGAKLVSYNTLNEEPNIQQEYNSFMDFVFTYCGTFSLSKQLKAVNDSKSLQPGDIFVYGGFPGHAVTVMAVAKNEAGKIIFLLSQGYMPAQDIHILKNYIDPDLSPWYDLSDIYPLYTPQWEFDKGSLKRW